MSDWLPASLAAVVTLQRGHDLPTTDRGAGAVPVIGSFGITGTHDVAKYAGPGVAIGRSGASIGVATYCPCDYWPLNTCLFVKDFQGNDPRWVYYLLDSIDFSGFNSGSAQPSLNRNYLANIPTLLPPVAEQRGIAATLGALDDKIESNRRAQDLILNLADTSYVAASNGGSAVPLSDVAEFHNRLRVPLSSQDRGGRVGPYPYYGATGVFGYVDDYLFDQVLVLVGEDGSVVNDNGTPVTQYIWGKTWINNHAHPLTGRGIPNELLLLALRHSDVRPIVTGAVQLKISMGNLKRLDLVMPPEHAIGVLCAEVEVVFGVYRHLHAETARLIELRDTLLPELLSGRIRVPEAREALAETALSV